MRLASPQENMSLARGETRNRPFGLRPRNHRPLLGLMFLSCLSGTVVAEESPARLTDVSGYALIQRGQVYVTAESATDLKPGDTVVIMEKSAAKVVQGGCTVDIQEGSLYTVDTYPNCAAMSASVVRVEPSFLPEAPRAPGALEVDLDAAERALERTLTEAGALLLPKGKAEVTPTIGYIRRETDSPIYVPRFFRALTLSEQAGLQVEDFDTGFLATQKTRRNEVVASLDFKVGLPWESQLEVGVPFRFVDQSTVLNLTQGNRLTDSQNASGLGDVSVGLAKTVFREKGALPDVVFRLTYDTGSGEKVSDGVNLQGGFSELRAGFSLLKRQDPLAFVAGLSYAKKYEDGGVEPGDDIGFSLGVVLAASPETTLQLAFQQTFSKDTKFDGRKIPESDDSQGILTIGASSILAKGVLLNVTAGAGLNDAAPDYFFQVSLPVRFDLF